MKSAYFDCVGGISGDMILGSIIDAGVPANDLEDALGGLNYSGFSLSCHKGQRGGVRGTLVNVKVKKQTKEPKRFRDFVKVTEESSLPQNVIERACTVFRRLAEAEAMAHGTSGDEVHLHELGQIDTLIDVVGSVMGLEMLGIERLYSSPLPSGGGIIKSEHGMLPAPAPATAALFAMARAPVVAPPGGLHAAGEMVTPTGAAIATTLATFKQPTMNMERVGYGLGQRESLYYPNVLCLWIGEENDMSYVADLRLIETNIDDMSPELLGYAQERLFELGARDVWFTPIQMKKNRPATMLCALVPAEIESQTVTLIIRETSSLGVRVKPVARYEADRKVVQVETSLGIVDVKIKRLDGEDIAVAPEYEACRRIALDKDMSLQEVYRIIQQESSEKLIPL